MANEQVVAKVEAVHPRKARVMIKSAGPFGYDITSRQGGLFGTQIRVRTLAAAQAIKALVIEDPVDRSARIDAVIKTDAGR